jgi:hypothetical protein
VQEGLGHGGVDSNCANSFICKIIRQGMRRELAYKLEGQQ